MRSDRLVMKFVRAFESGIRILSNPGPRPRFRPCASNAIFPAAEAALTRFWPPPTIRGPVTRRMILSLLVVVLIPEQAIVPPRK